MKKFFIILILILFSINFIYSAPSEPIYSYVSDTPVIISWALDKAYPGIEYNIRMGVVGGMYPYHYSFIQSPAGMLIDENSGEISWVPDISLEDQSFNVEVEVTDELDQKVSQLFTVDVTKTGFYFVSNGGDNSIGDGSFENPWKDINYAIQQGTNSNILYVRGGTYYERPDFESGTINKLIAYPGDNMPKLNLTILQMATRDDYTYFDGFEIYDMKRYGFKITNQDNVIIRRNHMHHLYDNSGAETGGGENPSFVHTVGVSSDNRKYGLIVQDNIFHDLFDRASGINGDLTANYHGGSMILFDNTYTLIEDNVAYNIDGACYRDKDNALKNTFRGNLGYNCVGSLGQTNPGIDRISQAGAIDTDILYNIIINENAMEIHNRDFPNDNHNVSVRKNTFLGKISTYGENIHFFDNIIYNPSSEVYTVSCNLSSTTKQNYFLDYNLLYSVGNVARTISNKCGPDGEYTGYIPYTFEEWKLVSGKDLNSFEANPLFTNLDSNNYKPLISSLACGNGYYGTDMGAVECFTGSDLNPPTKVIGLNAIDTSANSAYLSWNASSDSETGVKEYNIYRDGILRGTTLNLFYTDVIAPRVYYDYRVSAVDVYNNEGEKSEISQVYADYVPTPILNISSTLVDFGSLNKNINKILNITLESTGSAPIIISDFDYIGDFIFQNNCPNTLEIAQKCTLYFTFDNQSPGNYFGNLNISSNGVGSSFFNVNINGIRTNLTIEDLLIGHWDFENYSATYVYDNTKYENSGELLGDLVITNVSSFSNISNNYASFDGIDDVIKFSRISEFNLKSPFAISFWVNPSSTSTRILGKAGKSGSISYYFSTGIFRISYDGLQNNGESISYTLNQNQWQHIVGVYTGDEIQLYINGSLYDSKPYNLGISQESVSFNIGSRNGGTPNDQFFSGYLDEIKIYNISLLFEEVKNIYRLDLGLPPIKEDIPSLIPGCQENWNYSAWGDCIGEIQTRTANDLNSCGTEINKSIMSQSCVIISDSCGNNTIETGEICDGGALNGQTCQLLGYEKGDLFCKSDCSDYDVSSCIPKESDSSSSSGGSKSSKSSTFCVSCITNITIEKVCIPSYKYFEWGLCQDGKQTQFIEDINGCEGDILEQRNCQVELSEEENLLLNAKKIILNNLGKKKYKASLDTGYNEIFYVEEKLDDSIFLFEDEITGQEYYGQYYDSLDDKHFYTLKRVDEGYITILQEEGILSNSLYQDVNDLKQDGLFYKLIIGLVIILFIGILGYSFYYIKKIKRNENNFNE